MILDHRFDLGDLGDHAGFIDGTVDMPDEFGRIHVKLSRAVIFWPKREQSGGFSFDERDVTHLIGTAAMATILERLEGAAGVQEMECGA